MRSSNTGCFVVAPRPRPESQVRIYCFPFAGAGVSAFRGWFDAFDEGVEVCCIRPPGRETRHREASISNVVDLAQGIAGEMMGGLDRPYLLYGHSLGSLVAFETARLLRSWGAPLPEYLLVGASRSPQLPRIHPPIDRHLSDEEFFREVHRRYDSVPRQILDDAEIRELVAPGLRADIHAFETYCYRESTPIESPICAFGGTMDPFVSPQALDAWRAHTAGAFTLEMVPGGHLFLQTAQVHMVSSIARLIGRVGRSASSQGANFARQA